MEVGWGGAAREACRSLSHRQAACRAFACSSWNGISPTVLHPEERPLTAFPPAERDRRGTRVTYVSREMPCGLRVNVCR